MAPLHQEQNIPKNDKENENTSTPSAPLSSSASINASTTATETKSRIPKFDWALSQDETVVTKFVDIVTSKTIRPTAKEMDIIHEGVFYPGFFVGCVVGSGVFVALRRVPIYIMDRLIARDHDFLKKHSKRVSELGLSKPKPFQEGPVVKTIGTIFDAAVASLIGFGAWSMSVDKNKFLDSVSDIPLMEGHSEISNSLCPDFMNMYKNQVEPNFWKENTDDVVSSIHRFVHNCERRRIYQKQVRREKGLVGTDIEDVDLPSRVPHDGMLEDIDDDDDDDWAALEDFDED